MNGMVSMQSVGCCILHGGRISNGRECTSGVKV